MSSNTKLILALAGVGILLSLCLYQCKVNKDLKNQVVLVHDTTYIKGNIPIDTTKGSIKVIPVHVIYYDTLQGPKYIIRLDTVQQILYLTKDSLIHDTISVAFLEHYPKTPKLTFGSFRPNQIRLDLIYPFGGQVTKEYSVDYSKHRYEWYNDELHSIDTSELSNSFWANIKTDAYLYTTYNPIYKGTNFMVDYSLMYKGNFGLTAFAALSTYQSPALSGGIGLKVKIK